MTEKVEKEDKAKKKVTIELAEAQFTDLEYERSLDEFFGDSGPNRIPGSSASDQRARGLKASWMFIQHHLLFRISKPCTEVEFYR